MSPLTDIYAFLQISDRISTAGQPQVDQFPVIQATGHTTLINLAHPDAPGAIAHEADLVAASGLQYIHIPVLWQGPKIQDALCFFEAMNHHQEETVFIHCIANKRVSAFIYLYRVLCLGTDAATARQTLEQIWRPNAIWQSYIDGMVQQFSPRTAPAL
ncbi:protein tyrosine phosphatase family protein [Lyngbya confervoides]|uniref:Protein tyrosine phosphatase family protein n=1 Tax=Lyngbya confervoides BDU141951 TaxID=1574623 RepID=A0ABD4SZN3_9CYAN|nr:protein tyrosine phosphatase family protein [Lyngbya confervoides]MCM1981772.1 protein tyrosine phosphatase family protein [Lyngbya confervoides BDU141951]